MRSIKQNVQHDTLPNFRNLGIILRTLLICNGLAILQAILQSNAWTEVPQHLVQVVTLLTPILLSTMLLLWIGQPWLSRLSYWQGSITIMTLVSVLALSVFKLVGYVYDTGEQAKYYFPEARYVLLSLVACAILLLYFRLRARRLSRALHEARLQVLRARIRPHFLFNTINAVLGIVRAQPKKAETALEDMADLFRMAMLDAKDLVPLNREIKLSKQYIALEQLRMGERLKVDWNLQDVPEDALIPPLLLQPLLENAVYHGIEPLTQGGSINIQLRQQGDELRLSVENPYVEHSATTREYMHENESLHQDKAGKSRPLHTGKAHRANNKMALLNIRERLDLLFDAEARYEVESVNNTYRVNIVLPYVKDRSS